MRFGGAVRSGSVFGNVTLHTQVTSVVKSHLLCQLSLRCKFENFRISNFEFRNVRLNRNRKIHISSLDEQLVSPAARVPNLRSTAEISVGFSVEARSL
jgi:hypothetical protein